MATKKPEQDSLIPAERWAHALKAVDLVTHPPEISAAVLGQVHRLKADNLDLGHGAQDPAQARRDLRTSGNGVAIAQSVGSASGVGGAQFVGQSVPLQVDNAVSASTASSPNLTAHPPATSRKSSRWTGRMSMREQVHAVKTFAPLAVEAVDRMAIAIAAKKGNDPAYADALATLKELHHVLGQLIAQAERGRVTKAALRALEATKGKLHGILAGNASIILAEPFVAIAAAQSLEWASALTRVGNVEANATLVGAIYCALIGGEKIGGRKP